MDPEDVLTKIIASRRKVRHPQQPVVRQSNGKVNRAQGIEVVQVVDGLLEHSGEKFWRLPCTDDYKEDIKSSIADIMNTGKGRWGGAITAAMFLKEFAEDTPWIHLDIAGVAWTEEAKPWMAKGPSGIAVRSIVEWVRSYSNQ